jgi:putative transposase
MPPLQSQPIGRQRPEQGPLHLARELEAFLLNEYHLTPHTTTKEAPQARWDAGGFLPQMPASLEQLDLLLLTVPKTRKGHSDGIQFMGLRYIDPTLAAIRGAAKNGKTREVELTPFGEVVEIE